MDGTMINYNTGTSTGSMVMHDTQVAHCSRIVLQIFFVFRKNIFIKMFQPGPGTAMSRTMSELESTMGTMVINESENNTMNRYGTAPGQQVILASDWSVDTILSSYWPAGLHAGLPPAFRRQGRGEQQRSPQHRPSTATAASTSTSPDTTTTTTDSTTTAAARAFTTPAATSDRRRGSEVS